MSLIDIKDPAWYRALTLSERLKDFRPDAEKPPSERARKRLAAWRAIPPLDNDQYFRMYLHSMDAEPEDLTALLDESPESLCNRQALVPAWLEHLARCFEASDITVPKLSEPFRNNPVSGFLALVQPLTADGCRRLQQQARSIAASHDFIPFHIEAVTEALFEPLAANLLNMISRTMVLELNIARLRGELEGETPEQRFSAFTALLPERAPEYLRGYPVLARRVVGAVDAWVRAESTFLKHLADDRQDIADHFEIDPQARLTRILSGAGDSHSGGGSVHLLEFSDGSRLVYKPRPLGQTVLFQALLEHLNQLGAQPEFPLFKAMDRGDHGWAAFVANTPCQDLDQVSRYYRRIGGFLAVLHLLDSTDFHFENLIASGEHPVPIDLETLFHPRPAIPDSGHPDRELAAEKVSDSVLRVGLLPFSLNEEGFDISALAPVEGQQAPDRVLRWRNAATDEMHAERTHIKMKSGQNQPKLAGHDIDAMTWTDTVVQGFRGTYRLLMRHRKALAADSGPVAAFRGARVRAVLRPTRAYHLIQVESFHPDLLRDGLDRDRHLARLWTGLDENPAVIPALPWELADMAEGDIPLFYALPESRDLLNWQEGRLTDFFPTAPLDKVLTRLEQLSEEDLIHQEWLIRASLGTLALERDDLDWPSYTPREAAVIPPPDDLTNRLTAEAVRVGDRLEELAISNGKEVTWLGLSYTRNHWSLDALTEDLYGGTAGLVLFLAHLGRITGEARFTALARQAADTIKGRVERIADEIQLPGFFQGWGGLVYTFSQLARLWDEKSLEELATSFAKRGAAYLEEDPDLDVIGGGAGFILAVTAHAAQHPDSKVLDHVVTAGDILLKRSTNQGPDEIAWLTRVGNEAPLLGFSHGSAGISHALVRAYEATGERRFLDGALGAARYEHRAWKEAYEKPASNRRRKGEESALATSWCYGAPGIGLARLTLLRHLNEAFAHEDLNHALEQTRTQGFGRNHCLCHGDLGNLEMPAQAGLPTDEIQRRTVMILNSIAENGFLCGTPLSVESPGMMNGLAGIGYGLLRRAHPDKIPDILTGAALNS
ncbi:MAG: type 2 lanthipeptide synthetase LanM family protein [Acidobacteriota bacterium]|nr:type 2 lanthipeptide synthetase LanM family protein [Acidobacteriota bacterium]